MRSHSATRSGPDIARALLRLALGGTMIAHGVRHGKSIDGTARWFESIGFREPRKQAQASAVVEVGSGAALIVGAATPLAAASVVGTMAVAFETVHRPNGFFVINEGWEHVALVSAAGVALGALGPGRLSVDRLLGVDDKASGFSGAALVAGLGIGAAAAHLKMFWKRPAK
ncbi:MAG: putative oxidoreductase [Pseudonocardiales bacterium]|jgi:putative oxidoreductase|nr:putative oxidoreductase [Pseudonocardiales bacterium]MDT4973090.1 putative oxidoreductase [Pseudonocardiales bacterium]